MVVRDGGCLEGDALGLELLDPGGGALLGLVVLVVLVAEEAAEHAVADGLGVRVIVAAGRDNQQISRKSS